MQKHALLTAFHFQVFIMQFDSACDIFVSLSGSNFMITEAALSHDDSSASQQTLNPGWFRPTIQILVFTKTDKMNMKYNIIINSNLSQVSGYQRQLHMRQGPTSI
jgi:hypothetical protein